MTRVIFQNDISHTLLFDWENNLLSETSSSQDGSNDRLSNESCFKSLKENEA